MGGRRACACECVRARLTACCIGIYIGGGCRGCRAAWIVGPQTAMDDVDMLAALQFPMVDESQAMRGAGGWA